MSEHTYLSAERHVWSLNKTRVGVEEDRAQEPNLLDRVDILSNLNAVSDVVRVLHEEEDNRRKDFRQRRSDEPAQTYRELSVHSMV